MHAQDVVRKRRPYRRAQILEAAVKLFSERGFHETSMEDIGAVLGLTGPSIYRHFSGKREILEEAISEAGAAFWVAFDAVKAQDAPPEDKLRGMARVFVRAILDNPALTSLAVRERGSLGEDARAVARRSDRRLSGAWIHALAAARPELAASEARILVRGALGLAEAIAEMRTDLSRRRVADLAEQAMVAALLA